MLSSREIPCDANAFRFESCSSEAVIMRFMKLEVVSQQTWIKVRVAGWCRHTTYQHPRRRRYAPAIASCTRTVDTLHLPAARRLHNSRHSTPQRHCQRARSHLQNASFDALRWPTPRNDPRDKGQHLYHFPSNDVLFRHAGWCVVFFSSAG